MTAASRDARETKSTYIRLEPGEHISWYPAMLSLEGKVPSRFTKQNTESPGNPKDISHGTSREHSRGHSQSSLSIASCSGGFRGGCFGCFSTPSLVHGKKYLNLPFFFSMYGRYLFACSVSPVLKSAPQRFKLLLIVTPNHKIKFSQSVESKSADRLRNQATWVTSKFG